MAAYSILIPTKDRPNLLRRAVLSALASDAPDGEVIVIDDHSRVSARSTLADIADQRLRICTMPEGRTGVSAARNFGIAQAQGAIVFFLDDDDEVKPDYCRLVLAQGISECDYGFSAYLQVSSASRKPAKLARVRFKTGAIPPDAPLRKQLCGFGMGFWIWRSVAQQVGEITTELSINEDTEYLCRLITAGKRGWYSATPGVIVYAHGAVASDISNITARTRSAERARCMLWLCDRYPKMVAHLGTSYIRHCVKTGAMAEAWAFARVQPEWQIRNRLKLFAATKLAAYWLVRGLGRSRVKARPAELR